MAIALVTGQTATAEATATSVTATLPNNPATGNLVVVVVSALNTVTTLTVKDSNSNSYTATSKTPYNSPGIGEATGVFYLQNAPANATKSITVTVAPSSVTDIWVAEFSGAATSSVFENDATADSAFGTAVTTPSYTTLNNGDLLVSGTNGNTVSTANSPWTGWPGGVPASGAYAEYFIQSTAGAQSVNYTLTASGNDGSIIAAFKAAVGGATPFAPSLVFNDGPKRKPAHWIDFALPQLYPTLAKTPTVAVPMMPDMPVASKKQQWLLDSGFPQLYPTLAKTPTIALPEMLETQIPPTASKKQQWLDYEFPQIYPTLAPTPSNAIPMMADPPIGSKKQQWLDLFLPVASRAPTATPSFALPMMEEMLVSYPSRKQAWLDFLLPVLPAQSTSSGIVLVSGQTASGNAAGVGSITISLPNNPTAGNLVVVGWTWTNEGATYTVKDSANNSYTPTTHSPLNDVPNVLTTAVYYLANSPSGATKSITITANVGVGDFTAFVAEYSGAAVSPFEADATALHTSGASTTINTPSITPANNGDLLFSVTFSGTAISSANSPWTGIGSVQLSVNYAEYYVQPTAAAQAVNYTQTSGSLWDGVLATFKAANPGVAIFTPSFLILDQPKHIFAHWLDSGLPQFYPTLANTPTIALPMMEEQLPPVASKKQQWLDLLPAMITATFAPTPNYAVPTMPDMPVSSRKQQWLDYPQPLYGPTVKPPFWYGLPDVSIPSRKQQWLDVLPAFIDATFAATPQLAVPTMPDMPVASRKQQWLDLFLPIYGPLPLTVTYAIPMMADPATGKKQQWLDLTLPIVPSASAQTPSFALPMMEEMVVSYPSRKQQWLDLFLPIYGPLPQTPATAVPSMPDMPVATRVQQWLDLFLPVVPTTQVQVTVNFVPGMLDMPAPKRSQWIDPPLPIYGPLPLTPPFAVPAMPDMPIKTKPAQWADFLLPIAAIPTTYAFGLVADMPMPKRAQWGDFLLPLPQGAAVGPPTPSNFFDTRWFDGPLPSRNSPISGQFMFEMIGIPPAVVTVTAPHYKPFLAAPGRMMSIT